LCAALRPLPLRPPPLRAASARLRLGCAALCRSGAQARARGGNCAAPSVYLRPSAACLLRGTATRAAARMCAAACLHGCGTAAKRERGGVRAGALAHHLHAAATAATCHCAAPRARSRVTRLTSVAVWSNTAVVRCGGGPLGRGAAAAGARRGHRDKKQSALRCARRRAAPRAWLMQRHPVRALTRRAPLAARRTAKRRCRLLRRRATWAWCSCWWSAARTSRQKAECAALRPPPRRGALAVPCAQIHRGSGTNPLSLSGLPRLPPASRLRAAAARQSCCPAAPAVGLQLVHAAVLR
jgi:hypothetical protein